MQPGRQNLFVIAPIFLDWAKCVSRYKVSATCLTQNNVIAWAVARSSSMCGDLHSISCRPTEPKLDPIYRCSSDAVHGRQHTMPIQGICGRVILAPQPAVIDELSALLLQDGWPVNSMPNASQPWIDVTPDECISRPGVCKAHGIHWD